MNRPTIAALAIALAGLTPVLAACGSDEPAADAAAKATPSAAFPVISEDEFQTRGGALCEANAEAIASRFMALSQPPTEDEMAAAFDNLVAESYQISDDFAKLGAPAERQDVLARVIEANDRITAAVEAAGVEAFFADEGEAYAELEPLLEELGIPACIADEG
ncbi:hypothetical protein [Nocardioides humi]|uniref:Lipoprotein n=1 Tax=Nocardioides humi TaxID=449461 RepID=A0ABN1ZW27_9ACTN|nr:hypothetical protein [Nocardioides humi]